MSRRASKSRAWIYGCGGVLASWLASLGGCSSVEVAPPPPIATPDYLAVPHPAGTDTADLVGIFMSPAAPAAEKLTGCEQTFLKLRERTRSVEELAAGARELVRSAPEDYHWCFYGTLRNLTEQLAAEDYVDAKQKKVLDAYVFLVPVARAFMAEYRDSRYLRWSVAHYRRLSEWLFFRKVELSPQATSELVDVANPFGLHREPAAETPVLEKYNLVQRPAPAPSALASPLAEAVEGDGAVAETAPSPVPSPTAVEAEAVPTTELVEGAPSPSPAPVAAPEPARVPATAVSGVPVPPVVFPSETHPVQ